MSAKDKIKSAAVIGLFWNLIENSGTFLLNFLIGLVLIRIIDAQYFGIVGIMSFYMMLGNMLVSFSISNYLIQKPQIRNEDFSSSLWINLFLSIFAYLLILIFSEDIASYFNNNSISFFIKIYSLNIILSGLSVVQIADLSRKMNFKLLTKINLVGLLVSGIGAIILSVMNYGLWALVIFQLLNTFVVFVLLWLVNRWEYGFVLSLEAVRNILRFSFSIHLVNSINTLYTEIYSLIIGKLFNANQLAYYLRGKHTAEVMPQQFSNSLLKVLLPVMSNLQFDKYGLIKTYHKVLMLTGLINIPVLAFLAANGHTIFILLYTEKWLSAVIFYQLFCVEGMLMPLHIIGANMLIAKGKTKQFMYVELSKRLLQTIVIIATISSIELMVIGLIVLSIIYTLIAFYIIKFELKYNILDQVKQILPYIMISLFIFLINYLNNYILDSFDNYLLLSINIIISISFYLGILLAFKMESYQYIKNIIISKWYRL